MSWMEKIRIRANRNSKTQIAEMLEKFKQAMEKSEGLDAWQVYTNNLIESDFLIILEWNLLQVQAEGSSLTYNMVKALSPFGMVDHSIWIAQNRA